MSIDIQIIRILDLIDRFGSMSKAAILMGRVPSALSHAMSKAEKTLGVALVKPDGRTVELTSIGMTILNDGRELLQELEKLEKKVAQLESGRGEDLLIGIDINIPINNLLNLISQFLATATRTGVNVVQEPTEALVRALESRKLHFIIGAKMDRQTAMRNITTRSLLSSTQGLVISQQHPLANQLQHHFANASTASFETWETIVNQCAWDGLTWITLADDDAYAHPAELRPFIKHRLSVPHRMAQWQAIKLGLGVGFLPESAMTMLVSASKDDGRSSIPSNTPHFLAQQGLIWITSHPTWQISYQAAWNNQRMDSSLRWFVRQLDNIYLRTSLISA